MRVEDQVVRYAEIGGRQVAWTAVGRGPVFVMGGWWSSHLTLDWADEAFRAFVSALAAHHTVIRYDRPGSGRLRPGARRSRDTLAGELAVLTGLLDHLAAEEPDLVGGPVSLLGASAGCAVAAAYTAENPDRVARLVLYGAYARGEDIASPRPAPPCSPSSTHTGGSARGCSPTSSCRLRLRPSVPPSSTSSAGRRPATAAASLRAVYAFDSTRTSARCACPPWCCTGATTGRSRSRSAARSRRGAGIHVPRAAGRGPLPLDG